MTRYKIFNKLAQILHIHRNQIYWKEIDQLLPPYKFYGWESTFRFISFCFVFSRFCVWVCVGGVGCGGGMCIGGVGVWLYLFVLFCFFVCVFVCFVLFFVCVFVCLFVLCFASYLSAKNTEYCEEQYMVVDS